MKRSETICEHAGEEELSLLLSDVRAGSDPAFSRLVARYDALLLHRTSLFFRDGQEAQEAYQEACLALHRAALRFRGGEGVTFGLYAKICVDNALKSRYRKLHRGGASVATGRVDMVPFEENRFIADFLDPMVEQEKAQELLTQIRSELSLYEATVFDLYIEGASYAEIAKQLGRDEKSVKNALARMLAKLRKRLGN